MKKNNNSALETKLKENKVMEPLEIFNLLTENKVEVILKNNTITYKKDIAEMTFEITDIEKFKNNFFDVLLSNLIDFLSMLDS
ncbi:MAG: hypothetical protein E7059_02225 [Treponema bryantii]|nr:hypothetical protein [Treponema bryantii]